MKHQKNIEISLLTKLKHNCNITQTTAFDSSKTKRELGYTTRSCRETLRDEIQWLREIGKIA